MITKIEHGFRDWTTHLRLKYTLRAQNVAYVKGLMTILALLYWFIALCGLHRDHPRLRCRIACWERPSFFKTALDLLVIADELADELAFATWPHILAWLQDKLRHLRPLSKLYLLRYRTHRPWLLFLGNCKSPGWLANQISSDIIASRLVRNLSRFSSPSPSS